MKTYGLINSMRNVCAKREQLEKKGSLPGSYSLDVAAARECDP